MATINYRLTALGALQTRIGNITERLINRIADKYKTAHETPSHIYRVEFESSIDLGTPGNKIQYAFDKRNASIYAGNRKSSELKSGNIAANDHTAIEIIGNNALDEFLNNDINQFIQIK